MNRTQSLDRRELEFSGPLGWRAGSAIRFLERDRHLVADRAVRRSSLWSAPLWGGQIGMRN